MQKNGFEPLFSLFFYKNYSIWYLMSIQCWKRCMVFGMNFSTSSKNMMCTEYIGTSYCRRNMSVELFSEEAKMPETSVQCILW